MINQIKVIRKKKGWTQEQLANAVGVKRSVISKYENGSVSPSVETVYHIAEALGVQIRELLSDEEKKEFDIGYSLALSGYTFSPKEHRMIAAFWQLNDEGQIKAAEYAEDILPLYRRIGPPPPPETWERPPEGYAAPPLPSWTSDASTALAEPQEGTDTTPPSNTPGTPPEGE